MLPKRSGFPAGTGVSGRSLTALFALVTAITIPALFQMEKVPLLLMGPRANIELLIAFVALDWFIGARSHNW